MNLKELSQTLGLSQTTVSRALNGYPEVSESTRSRVMQAAIDNNYRPNARAKGLATGRAMTIGHVIPLSNQHEMVNPIFGDFISGAGEVYSGAQYDMLLSVVGDKGELQAYRELNARRAVDGVILHGPRVQDPRIQLLQELKMPFVVHGRSTELGEDYPWVDVNNRRAFHRATDFLLDMGHRRIALLNGIESMDFARRRRDGFEAAHIERGVPVDISLMRADEMTENYGYTNASHMLAQSTPPTAFLISSLVTAYGVRRATEERGLRLGRDVSLVTHDDDLSYMKNGGDVPIFTATRSSVRDAGRKAATMLLDIIRSADQSPENILMEAELMVGQSTGPAPRT